MQVFNAVSGSKVVLFGEGSHGTQEFYELRCEITKLLITNAGCMAVCIEGDFPETTALHRFVMGASTAEDVDDALEPFHNRFAVWMWRRAPSASKHLPPTTLVVQEILDMMIGEPKP